MNTLWSKSLLMMAAVFVMGLPASAQAGYDLRSPDQANRSENPHGARDSLRRGAERQRDFAGLFAVDGR